MCDCIKKVEQNAMAHSRERFPHSVISGECNHFDETGIQQKGFGLDGPFLYFDFKFLKSDKKKDGTYTKPKKISINLFFNFCPFCGEKYKQ